MFVDSIVVEMLIVELLKSLIRRSQLFLTRDTGLRDAGHRPEVSCLEVSRLEPRVSKTGAKIRIIVEMHERMGRKSERSRQLLGHGLLSKKFEKKTFIC